MRPPRNILIGADAAPPRPIHVPTELQVVKPAKINWVLFICFVAGACYGDGSPIYQIFLILPIVLLAGLSVYYWLAGTRTSSVKNLSLTMAIGCAITIFALLGATFQSDGVSVAYATLFLVLWASTAACIGYISQKTVYRTFALSGCVVIIGFTIVGWQNLVVALSFSGIGVDAMDRYGGPFGAHPNLIGHLAGCFSIVMFWQAKQESVLVKCLFGFAILLGIIMCIAASSRGGLFAAVGSTAVIVLWEKSRTAKGVFQLFSGVAIIGITTFLFVPELLSKLVLLLQLDSADRGIDSGLTGRLNLWGIVLAQFGTSHEPLIWGAGFRSQWLSDLTEAIDNGYLVTAAELGVVGAGLWCLQVFRALWTAAARRPWFSPGADKLALAVITYSLSEAVVARYFLAIGNSASLFLIMLVIMIPSSPSGRAAIR